MLVDWWESKSRRQRVVWLGGGALLILVLISASVRSNDQDDPPTMTRAEVNELAAEQTWDNLSAIDRADVCDGLRFDGEGATLRAIIEGTDGDEELAEALLAVAKDNC